MTLYVFGKGKSLIHIGKPSSAIELKTICIRRTGMVLLLIISQLVKSAVFFLPNMITFCDQDAATVRRSPRPAPTPVGGGVVYGSGQAAAYRKSEATGRGRTD